MSDRFEREYLRSDREEVEWQKLEKKLDAKTINCRATPEMRDWFQTTFGYKADDCSVIMRWNERYQND